MSAKFIWVRNPTAINGLATTYVSLRGDDVNGDGTAQNPYRSLAKATTMAEINTNIMLDDGFFNEDRSQTKTFKWWGNSRTKAVIKEYGVSSEVHNMDVILSFGGGQPFTSVYSCRIVGEIAATYSCFNAYNSIITTSVNYKRSPSGSSSVLATINRCIVAGNLRTGTTSSRTNVSLTVSNSIVIGNIPLLSKSYYNNFVEKTIPANSIACINNLTTGQNSYDYFNRYDNNYLIADFTAKAGSANIGAGENGTNIGLNEGYAAHATNDSSDIFSEANGATVRNVVWSSALNGYVIAHKDKVCLGSTTDTITLAADAEATDDYYNGLFIGITTGSGYFEIHRITDYDGTTKVATIDGNWTTQPDTQSVYSITGSIVSATKDYGILIQIKQNWAFCANMESWTKTDNAAYGMWKEFITTPLLNNGVWELRPCSNFRYEYSLNGTDWYSNTELIAGTDTENKTDGDTYGNASENYTSAVARTTRLRYARFHIEIGFNIGEDA